MAVDQTFASAYLDNGNVHKILGLKLRRFCPWHLFQLQVVESPFLFAGEVILFDLRRAVGICRLKFPNSRTRLPIFPLVINQERLSLEVKKFLVYLGDYLQRPEYTIMPADEFGRSKRAPRNPGQAPEAVQLAFDASHGANVPINEAWNMPIGQAYIAQAMYLRQQGLMVDFLTEKERDFQSVIREAMKKSKNGEK